MEFQPQQFSFSKYVSTPRQSSVEIQVDTKLSGSFSLRNLVSIQCDCWTVFSFQGKSNIRRFIFIVLYMPAF